MFNATRDSDYQPTQDSAHSEQEEQNRRKNYRRGREFRPSRRRSRKATAANPGLGFSGRRNRRWSW